MKTGQYLLGFNFFLLKPDSFGGFWSILKEEKLKGKLSGNMRKHLYI